MLILSLRPSSRGTLGDTLAQASDLLPLLLQTVEKAATQNSQYALLAEGVAASVLLSRLSLVDSLAGQLPFQHFLSLVLGTC